MKLTKRIQGRSILEDLSTIIPHIMAYRRGGEISSSTSPRSPGSRNSSVSTGEAAGVNSLDSVGKRIVQRRRVAYLLRPHRKTGSMRRAYKYFVRF